MKQTKMMYQTKIIKKTKKKQNKNSNNHHVIETRKKEFQIVINSYYTQMYSD